MPAIVGIPLLQVAERSIILIVAAFVITGAITVIGTTIYFAFMDIEEDANDGTRNLYVWIGRV